MEDKRSNLRKHINAARDWLQEADKSIERKEDVQGDLKLMLAKAELKNAEKHQNLSRFKNVLSFVTAAAVAFGIILFSEQPEVAPEITPPSTEVSALSNTNSQDQPVSVSSISSEENTKSKFNSESLKEAIPLVPDRPANIQTEYPNEPQISYPKTQYTESYNSEREDFVPETKIYVEPEPISENFNTNVEAPIKSEPSEPKINLEAKAPTEDMQKLMQSAGQILRAE